MADLPKPATSFTFSPKISAIFNFIDSPKNQFYNIYIYPRGAVMLVRDYIKSFAIVLIVVFIVLNPYFIIESVKSGLYICYENVIPSLFVFMVIANYAAQDTTLKILSFPLRWYSKLMKVEDHNYSGYLLLSLIGGFAVGAKFINRLENNNYNEKAVCVLGTAMISNSLGFCIFTLGAGMLKNYIIGLFIYMACAIANLITAFVLSFIYEYNIITVSPKTHKSQTSITDSINNAVSSILSICGFVVIFNTICEAISLYSLENKTLSSLICVFVELTSGCIKIINYFNNKPYLLCFTLSILPISTLCQVFYFTQNKSFISLLLKSRLIHTPVSLMIFSVLLNLFPTSVTVASFNDSVLKSFSYNAELSFTLFVISMIFLKIFDQNKLFTNTTQ